MADLFMLALLGHLVGDYLLQTKQMALTKSAPGWPGALTCTLHVAIYTVAVTAFLATATLWAALPLVMLFIAVPHWLIDRYSLASHWLRLIRGRTFEAAAAPTDNH